MKYLIGLCAFTLVLQATPEEGHVVHGDASWHQDGNQLHISAGDKAIIDWNHFSIKEGEAVHFIQSGRDSAVLNRDIGGLRSDILGTLTGAGKVYLINKSGIFIGKDAMIDTGSFIGSTFDVLNEDFIRGGELLFSESDGVIVNKGKITAEGGELILISRDITQEGVLKGQDVHLIEGCEVLYKPHGTERVYARGTSYQSAIKNSGSIEALGVENRGGKIFLVAERVVVSGDLTAHSGEVRALGDHVHVDGRIDVSGESGGTILIGGDYQGNNPDIKNAKTTFISEKAELIADSTGSGNGGRVIVWSDNGTRFLGEITAQGGPLGGDGGFVEVSGKLGLDYRGNVTTLAPLGKTGTLLLDPVDITIQAVADNNITNTAGTITGTACLPGTNLSPATLIGILGGTSVIVQTSFIGCLQNGNITVLSPVIYSSPNSLTLQADNNIFVGANIQNSDTIGSGSITLTAASSILVGYTNTGVDATQPSIIGSLSAPVTLTATNGSILIGDTTSNFPSQVGWGFAPLANPPGAPIILSATTPGQNIILDGGNGTAGSYAQVGHGSLGTAYQGLSGNITVTAGSNVTLNAATAQDEGYALIGHGGVGINNTLNNVSGIINVTATNGSVSLTGGAGLAVSQRCFAQIGHAGVGVAGEKNAQQTLGNINITSGLDLSLTSGTNLFCYAQVGHGGAFYEFDELVFGDILINVGRNASITTNNGIQAPAMIGHGGYLMTTENNLVGNITINGGANSTLTMQAFNGVTGGGNNINFTQIGHGGALTKQGPTSGFAWVGDISVTVSGLASLSGGDNVGNYTQIGHGGYSSLPNNLNSTNLSLTCGSLSMIGSSGPTDNANEAYCQIGHGGSSVNLGGAIVGLATGSYSGNVTVTTTKGSISMDGGATTPLSTQSLFAPSQIGHGGANPTYTNMSAVSFTGLVDVTSATQLTMTAGSSSNAGGNGGAWIGHGPISPVNVVPVTINATVDVTAQNGSLTLTGGLLAAGTDITAVIGNGLGLSSPNTTFAGGDQTVTASQGITLNGGGGQDAATAIVAPSGVQLVTATGGDIILQGGSGNNAGSAIFSGGTSQTVQSTAGKINILAGVGLGTNAQIQSSCTTQTIEAFQDILARGGTSAAASNALVNNTLVGGLTKIVSDTGSVFFQNGGPLFNAAAINLLPFVTGASIEVDAAKDITLSSDVNVAFLGTSTILIHANTSGNGLGSFIVDTNGYDSAGGAVALATHGILFIASGNAGVPLTILATDKSASGLPVDFVVGDSTDLSGPPSAYLGGIGHPTLPAAFETNSGTISVSHYRDIWFISSETNPPFNNTSVSAPKGVATFVADNNMHLTAHLNPPVILAQSVTLVVDNYFPTSPNSGSGMFLMDPFPVHINSGHIKIFTSKQPLNSTGETLGTLVFVPGVQFVNTNHEQWGDYFNNPFFGGPQYTIFYKNTPFVPPVVPTVPPTGAAIYQAQTGMSQMFFDLRDYDDRMYFMKFYISYNRDKYLTYNATKREMKKVISYLDNYQKAYYWKWIFRGVPALKSISSYEVDRNEEYMLPPRWKGFIE